MVRIPVPALRVPFPRSFVLGGLCLALATPACGASQADRERMLANLRGVIDGPVQSVDESRAHSRVVEDALSNDVLSGMTRQEVAAAIGAGDPCSRHPRCEENGFQSDDWHYTAGQMGDQPAGTLPTFIVGFDRTGRVARTWSLRIE